MLARVEYYLENDDKPLGAHEGAVNELVIPVAGDTICFVSNNEGIPYRVESRDILYLMDASAKAVRMRVQIFLSAKHGMVDPGDFPIKPWKKQKTVH